MAGTFPNVAQSPQRDQDLAPLTHHLGNFNVVRVADGPLEDTHRNAALRRMLRSVTGLDVISTASSRFTMRSSMSRIDI